MKQIPPRRGTNRASHRHGAAGTASATRGHARTVTLLLAALLSQSAPSAWAQVPAATARPPAAIAPVTTPSKTINTPPDAASMPNTSERPGQPGEPRPGTAASQAAAQGQPVPEPTKVSSVHHLTEYALPNGMRFILGPDDSRPATSVNLVYRVGSRQEGPGEAGMAHLLEHMMFKGTPATPDPKSEFSRRGMRYNASTSYDRTNYFAQFAASPDNLRWMLGWLADTMTELRITDAQLASERTVVLSEMQAGENRPERVLFQQALASAYRFHPYGRAVIGTPSDLDHVRASQLQAFYQGYYRPDNAVLVVTGQFDAQATLKTIATLFGAIPKPVQPMSSPYTLDPVQNGEREVTVRRTGGVPSLNAVYHMPAGATREALALATYADIISRKPDGQLYQAVVKSGLAASAGGSTLPLADPGVMIVSATPNDAARTEETWQAMRTVLEGDHQVDPEGLKRTQLETENELREALESPDSLAMMLTEPISLGDWRLSFAQAQWLREMTPAEVKAAADRYLLRDNRTLARYVPTDEPKRAPAPERADAGALLAGMTFPQAEPFKADWALTPDSIESHLVRATLPHGMKVAVLPRRTLGDRVYVQMTLHWGDVASLTGRWPGFQMMGALMGAGTATMPRQAFEDRMRALDARYDFQARPSGLEVTLQVPAGKFDETMGVVADVLRHPAFPADEFDERQRNALAAMSADLAQPESQVATTLAGLEKSYPQADPRTIRTPAQRVEDMRSHTVDALRRFHKDFVSASHGEVAIVGPVDAAGVRQRLESLFDDWTTTVPYARIERPYAELPAVEKFTTVPDKQNAVLFIGQKVPLSEDSPDYLPLAVAIQLLGGDASARIGQRVREKDGLSYSSYAALSADRRLPSGSITMRAIHAPANVDRLREAFAETLKQTLAEGFTQKELDDGLSSLVQRRRRALVSEASVASILNGHLEWDETMARWKERDERLSRLTLAEVNAALRKYLKPEALTVIGAGTYPEEPQPLPATYRGQWPATEGAK